MLESARAVLAFAVSIVILEGEGATGGEARSSEPRPWAQHWQRFQRLGRAQLRSRPAWELVGRQVLPQLRAEAGAIAGGWAAAAATSPHAAQEQELRVALALAERPCANPGCTTVLGCSEGRQRGWRCSRCSRVRYCGPACQAADWPQHGRVCKEPAEAGLGESGQE